MYFVASELKDPICHSDECQIGSFSSEATISVYLFMKITRIKYAEQYNKHNSSLLFRTRSNMAGKALSVAEAASTLTASVPFYARMWIHMVRIYGQLAKSLVADRALVLKPLLMHHAKVVPEGASWLKYITTNMAYIGNFCRCLRFLLHLYGRYKLDTENIYFYFLSIR